MPRLISKRVLEHLEKKLDISPKLAPIIFYTIDNFGRCTITNLNYTFTIMIFKTKKSMKNYLTTVFNRNDIIYICDDLDI